MKNKEWKWINIKDELPVIPKGRHAVSVLVAVFDSTFEEIKENDKLITILRSILIRRTDEYTADQIIKEMESTIKDFFPHILVPISKIDRIIMQLEKMDDRIDSSDDIKHLITQNLNGFIYLYTYADEDGPFWSEMEHGGTFNKLPHVKISHH